MMHIDHLLIILKFFKRTAFWPFFRFHVILTYKSVSSAFPMVS